MRLTPELAQPIVDRAMAILQRNVNIMNEQGVIVASGDPARVGQRHQAAESVLRTGRRVEVEAADRYSGAREGVNLALRLNGRRVGVVGITGSPAEVRPFGEVIREMVQLMLAQAEAAELERTAALAREGTLRDLMTGAGQLSERTEREALLVGLHPESSYRVLLLHPANREAVEAAAGALGISLITVGPWQGRLVIICTAMGEELATRLQLDLGAEATVAVGLTGTGLTGLRRSYQTAQLAMEAGRRLSGTGLFLAEALRLQAFLTTAAPEEAMALRDAAVGGLPPQGSRQGQLLRQTAETYARSALSLGAAAEALGIHRHTLTYRLDQITELTGLDPRTWSGALSLYLALQIERLFGQNVEGRS